MAYQLEIEVSRARFMESWYVGDPDDQEGTDFEEDLEVSGRASGTLVLGIEDDNIEEFAEMIDGCADLRMIEEWFENVDDKSFSSEVASLEQDVQESNVPRDRDDDTLAYARITLEDAVDSIKLSLIDDSDVSITLWCVSRPADSKLYRESAPDNSDQLIDQSDLCSTLSRIIEKNLS